MDGFFERLLGFTLAAVVGLVIGGVLLFIRILRNRRNWPSDERRQQLLTLIREWKREGLDYPGRLDRLMEQGFRKDVADMLLGEAERNAGKQ